MMNGDILHKYQIQADQYRLELTSISEKLNQHARIIEDCIKSSALFEEMKIFKQEQISSSAASSSQVKSLQEGHRGLFARMDALEKSISQLRQSKEEMQNAQAVLSDSHKALTQKVDTLPYEKQVTTFQKGQASVNADLYGQIAKTRADLVVSPAQIISNNNDLVKKVEAAVLDGSNATSKIANFELQIRVLEKKIESLGILLKKLELGQQLA